MLIARDIMTPNPASCFPEQTMYDAVRLMDREDCGVVPIVNAEQQCVGIITDRDICLRIVLDHHDPFDTPLSRVMNVDVISASVQDPVDAIMDKMARSRVRRMPILDERNCLVGIISECDIAHSELRHALGAMMDQVLELD